MDLHILINLNGYHQPKRAQFQAGDELAALEVSGREGISSSLDVTSRS